MSKREKKNTVICPKCGNSHLKICWIYGQHSVLCEPCEYWFPLRRNVD